METAINVINIAVDCRATLLFFFNAIQTFYNYKYD